jgi:hypothetical protein
LIAAEFSFFSSLALGSLIIMNISSASQGVREVEWCFSAFSQVRRIFYWSPAGKSLVRHRG